MDQNRHHPERGNRGIESLVSRTCVCVCMCVCILEDRRRFSGDRAFDTLVVLIRIGDHRYVRVTRFEGDITWFFFLFSFSFFLLFFLFFYRERERETHLSIEPRRALAIIRSAVRKRVASSFTAHRHSMALYFLSLDVSVLRAARMPSQRVLNILLPIHF